jgi:hypothetical protein
MAETKDLYLKPHSVQWFAALEHFDAIQAFHTRQIIEQAGREDICGVCGSDPASDYRVPINGAAIHVVLSVRLCEGCKVIRAQQGEVLEKL